MKRAIYIGALLMAFCVMAFATTKWRDVNIVNSTIDKTTSWGRFSSARKTTGCTTGSSSFSTCTDALTWDTPFADTTNLNVHCDGVGESNPRAAVTVQSYTTSGVTAITVTNGSVAVNFAEIHCQAYHP